MTESAPMNLTDALNVMREPTASALAHRDKVVVALYPYGTAHGGTMMVTELTHDNALALYDQLAEAIKLLEAK